MPDKDPRAAEAELRAEVPREELLAWLNERYEGTSPLEGSYRWLVRQGHDTDAAITGATERFLVEEQAMAREFTPADLKHLR